jgi:hypothetical protein
MVSVEAPLPQTPNYEDPTPIKTSAAPAAPHHHAVRVAVTATSQPGVYEMRVLRIGEIVVSGAQEALVVMLAPGTELTGRS